MSNPYFINPSVESLSRALESWHWLDLNGKRPILVTAFADVFLIAPDGIWVLDTLEGNLKHLYSSREQFDQALTTVEMEDTYLMSPLVDYLIKSGLNATDTQCYDYKVHPRVGGQINHENMELRNFVVALNLRGQLHEQVRHMAPGTPISGVRMQEGSPSRPWWKLW
jgi:hypothetical protein